MSRGWTNEQFLEEVKNKRGTDFTFLEEYKGSNVKIKVKHKCGYSWDVKPNTFLNIKTGCPKCSGKLKKTTEMFKDEVNEMYGDEYTVMGEYKNKSTHIDMRHNICGNVYPISPNHFLRGRKCPRCSVKGKPQCKPKTNEEFSKEVSIIDSDYEFIGNYTNNKTKTDFKHLKCGKTFSMRPDSFVSGDRCPKCKRSIGEEEVEKSIIKYLFEDYVYRNQHTFKSCRNEKVLPFDFVIFKKSGKKAKPVLAIEFDGEQHFKPTFGEEAFKRQLVNDGIKNGWCIAKNIPLERIPYTEQDNIDAIIKDILTRL